MPVSSIQFGQSPWKYTNGLQIRNSIVTPNTLIRVQAGSVLDNTGIYQISSNVDMSGSLLINGAGGIDTGTVSANTVYGLYLIGDSVGLNPTTLMFSLAYGSSVNGPLIPVGYSVFAFIGCVTTDSMNHILPGRWSGNDSSYRMFTYDSPVNVLSGGASNTYAGVSLSGSVPIFNSAITVIYSNFSANAAGDILNLTPYLSTGDAVSIVASVAGSVAHITNQNTVTAVLNPSIQPTVNYKVSAGSVSLYVCSYTFIL